ncbi:hypothetical protein KAM479_05420 [Aeromonas caviae]|nr:hypothetical protein KAM497c_29960 [Aeromonas caviae]GJA86088.1 hypothetical protein KAM356_21470 [Aeromonas caviae]GJA90070.1 hypothetical protein KAM357_20180 [Aeromonas caviae]GJB07246.1 hypothetical protein KAM361_19190 [Aeromonas caviae]GJB15872.1 hypothetical protein KAM363_18770 [Aeromonas caviae]
MLFLDIKQFTHQTIVFGVRYSGLVQHIVLVAIVGEQFTQLTVAGEGIAHGRVSKCDGTFSLGHK